MEKTTALITGASSGIGQELAKLFAADGHNLILVARRMERLQIFSTELQKLYPLITVQIVASDLSEPCAAEQVFALTQHQPLTYLVNNAGFGNFEDFINIDLICDRRLLQLNILALTELTKLCLPILLKQQQAYILNVASTAAFQPGPYMATYFASKAYVLSFSEALAHELRQTQVRVTCLCPGPTATEFHTLAKIEHSPLFRHGVMPASKVATIGYRAMLHGKRVVIPGLQNKLLTFATRLIPRYLSTMISGFLLNLRRQTTYKK